MPENFANSYQTRLIGGISAADLTGTVASTGGVPALPFRAIISAEGANTAEIVLVTSRVAADLTWTRAAEPIAGVQVASAHASGATFTAIVTAAQVARMNFGNYDVTRYGASPSATGAVNSTAMQAAIDAAAAAGGGQVFIPAGTYTLASSLTLKRGVAIKGVYPGVTPLNASSWDIDWDVATGTILTFPGGTVFTQDTSGGLGTLSAIDGIVIESLGFNNVASIVTCGATNKSGICGSQIRNIIASNVTGTAFDLKNAMHLSVTNIKIADCYQFIVFTGDYDSAVINHNPGNSIFQDLYCLTSTAGMAQPTIHIRTLDPNGNGTPCGLIRFKGVQVNRWGNTVHAGAHLKLEGADLTAAITTCVFEDIDLEGYAQHRIWLVNAEKNRFIMTAGSSTQSDDDFYARTSKYSDVWSMDPDMAIDVEAASVPIHFNGTLKSTAGVYRPIGLWYQGDANAVKFSTGSLGYQEVLTDAFGGTWTMPYTHMDFNTTLGGGVMERYTDVAANAFDMNLLTMGVVTLSFAGAVAVTLPTAVGLKGQRTTFKKTGAGGTATLTRRNAETIDGATTNVWLDTQYKFITLQSDGANWLIVSKG